MSRHPGRLNWINGTTTAVAVVLLVVGLFRLVSPTTPGDRSGIDLIWLSLIVAAAGAGAGFIYNSVKK